MQCRVKFWQGVASGRRRATAGGNLSSARGRRESWSETIGLSRLKRRRWAVPTNRIAKHNVLAREDVATLMDLREALATVVTAEDETPLRGALDALWASDLPPTTMLHVRRIQTGNVAGLGEGKRVSCEE